MRHIILTAALAAATATPASATIFYEQRDSSALCRNGCTFSQVGPYAPGRFIASVEAFDDFRLDQDSSINTIRWQGFYQSDRAHIFGDAPPSPNTRMWRIDLSADDGGTPGAVLQSNRIDPNDVRVDLIRPATTAAGYPTDWNRFTARLPTAFEAAAGTRYWLSIVAEVDDWQSQFTWSSSARPGNGAVQQFQGIPGPRRSSIANRAFSVGNDGVAAVPEPASWAMMIGGFGLVGLASRRRRASRQLCV